MYMNRKHQSGLTLIELIIFMVITGVASAGIMLVLNMGATNSVDPLRRKQAMLIAEAYMEEVRQTGFTACYPEDANLTTAKVASDCATAAGKVAVQARAGIVRPYENVADYATALGQAQRSFKPGSGTDDVDVNGRALGRDQSLATMGNSSLGAIVTTVELNVLSGASSALGPAGQQISSDANNLNVMRITVRTVYGTGPNDSIQLDGYRTRYAPGFSQ